MEPEHIEKVLSACKLRAEVKKFSYLANLDEVKENDYNLNIPRYVDTYEEEILPPLEEIFKDYKAINDEIYETEIEILKLMNDLVASDQEGEKELELLKDVSNYKIEKGGQLKIENERIQLI